MFRYSRSTWYYSKVDHGAVTELLIRSRSGDESAVRDLFPLLYDQLKRLAHRALASESAGHTVGPTALVNEAYLRLAGSALPVNDRAHFFALASRVMRRVLVDYARTRGRAKRGGGAAVLSLEEQIAIDVSAVDSLPELDLALDRLAGIDERKAKAIELIFFGGLSFVEAAEALQISEATLARDVKFAKAWLKHELG